MIQWGEQSSVKSSSAFAKGYVNDVELDDETKRQGDFTDAVYLKF